MNNNQHHTTSYDPNNTTVSSRANTRQQRQDDSKNTIHTYPRRNRLRRPIRNTKSIPGAVAVRGRAYGQTPAWARNRSNINDDNSKSKDQVCLEIVPEVMAMDVYYTWTCCSEYDQVETPSRFRCWKRRSSITQEEDSNVCRCGSVAHVSTSEHYELPIAVAIENDDCEEEQGVAKKKKCFSKRKHADHSCDCVD